MIKWLLLLPVKFGVARLAVFSQSTQMRLLLCMARCAYLGSRPEVGACAVTSRALCFGVTADKRIVRELMVERRAVKMGQLKAATMMFAMADFARLRFCCRLTVKTRTLLDIARYPLVTGQTFPILGLTRK
ncbi:MAG: hypothetical protein RLZZ366_1791 [Pseudomonadota bacterium]